MGESTVRAYRTADRDAVRRIACETAEIGSPLTADFPYRDFISDVLTSYYTDLEPGSSWVAVNSGGAVVGYLNGCLDTRRYLAAVPRRIVPFALVRALPTGLFFSRAFWRFLWAGILSGKKSGSYHHRWLSTHPAHFHINLLPEGRASGLGRRLLENFREQARAAGAGGLHLGTRGDNENARRFFERQGFSVLERPVIVDPFTLEEREMWVYGVRLP